ncbi:RteC domain-containing protein [Belliella kenyensis]|uniref:RteC domain-containing protein n=1 Tax=Belliella kenyensis TaxID=1472724 RepID=A0ABV8EPU5_9BACT|nr:RteC domain-containing protein [Belliella kenyensis]MCH7400870.1 RteC domain-containing protein [Belliella kenyensis]MDN3601843.1 RteC domain-containing protein [Belliella kenyensis]
MLRGYTEDLIKNLEKELDMLSFEDGNKLQQLEQAFHLSEVAVVKLRNYLDKYTFESEAEEIEFFKHINPQLLQKTIFYAEYFFIESKKPVGRKKSIKHHYNKAIRRLSMALDQKRDIYQYALLQENNMDNIYFLRNADMSKFRPYRDILLVNPKYDTLHSYMLGKAYAWVQLIDLLKVEIKELEKQEILGGERSRKLRWTAPKVQLIELIYALKASGVFNNGTADIKEIANTIGLLFDKQLTDYYRTFQEIRFRKKSRTVFLDTMQERLIQWMEESEGL